MKLHDVGRSALPDFDYERSPMKASDTEINSLFEAPTDEDDVFGHNYRFSLGKISGNFKYNYSQSAMSDTYDHNDLGYLRTNNIALHRNNSAIKRSKSPKE